MLWILLRRRELHSIVSLFRNEMFFVFFAVFLFCLSTTVKSFVVFVLLELSTYDHTMLFFFFFSFLFVVVGVFLLFLLLQVV